MVDRCPNCGEDDPEMAQALRAQTFLCCSSTWISGRGVVITPMGDEISLDQDE